MRKVIVAAIALLNVAACSYTQETTQAYSAPTYAPDGTDVSGAGIYIGPWTGSTGLVARSGLSSRPDDPNGTGAYFAVR